MGLSAWNAYRARKAAEEKVLNTSITENNVSTSPAKSGDVETVQPEPVVESELEEPKPKKKRK